MNWMNESKVDLTQQEVGEPPEGLIHMATPNFLGPSARLFGPHWYDLDAPRHQVLLNPYSVRLMAQRADLEVLDLVHEVNPSIFWASLQLWLSDRPRGRWLASKGGNWRHNPVMRYLLWPIWWLLARRGYGERMHVLMRRATPTRR